MKQHRILFLNHSAVLGGGELSLLDLAEAYRASSEVLLFSEGEFSEKLRKLGIQVEVLAASEQVLSIRATSTWKSLQSIATLWKLAGKVSAIAQDFDLIHANSQKAFIVAALARLRGSPPVVWHLRDILTADHFSRLNCRIAVTLANYFASQVIVNSQATGKAFVELGGKEKLVNVVYNGICPHRFQNLLNATTEDPRKQLGIGDVPLVGIFSRLSYWKGQHIVLEALQPLSDVHILMVGDALFGETEYVAKLKALSDLPELEGRVHWLGFRHDIPPLMRTCDIIVNPSTAPEPFGRTIIEAQLAGKPIIAAAAGGAIELIEDGKNGYLFPPKNVEALTQIIETLLRDRALSFQIAQQGTIRAQEKFSLAQSLSHFDAVLEKV